MVNCVTIDKGDRVPVSPQQLLLGFTQPTVSDIPHGVGVENGVASIPSHSEPCVKVSPHTAPSLTAPLLRTQRWRCLVPFYHRDSGGAVIEDSCIHPFHLGFEVQCGLLQLGLMG